jgi:hypothetical protein
MGLVSPSVQMRYVALCAKVEIVRQTEAEAAENDSAPTSPPSIPISRQITCPRDRNHGWVRYRCLAFARERECCDEHFAKMA